MNNYRLIALFFVTVLLSIQAGTAQETAYPGFVLSQKWTSELQSDPVLNNTIPQVSGERRSVGKAFFMSLVVPGSGELYVGKKRQGRFFLGAELVLWAGLLANQEYVRILEDDYYAYAAQHAGVDRTGKGEDYWVDIGKYDDLFSFNEQRRRDRFVDAIYPEDENYYWKWDSRENRFVYDGKRITANEISNRDTYFYAVIVLNHLVSGINAMRLARKYNKSLARVQDWNIRFFAHRENAKQHRFGFRLVTTF
jgi:hypothetical protein